MKLVPNAAPDIQTAVTSYLEKLSDSEAKSAGIRLGQEVAAGILEMRANDGASAADAYRPKTRPGVYIPTAITIGWAISHVTPFALTSPAQFRPKPPPSLKSAEWARDYNEIKEFGEKNSAKRTARQTEDARFWISVNPGMSHQLERQIVVAKNMDTVDSAHFMALASVAEADACIALFDAKYKYEFWRPITAIRNGDIDGNPATERVATWQPIDATPMHPEYPCAHCIVNSAVAAVVKAVLGTDEIPEVALTGELYLAAGMNTTALVEFEASLKVVPNRFRTIAGAAAAARASGTVEAARRYYRALTELAAATGGDRPEIAEARTYLAQN
jgi:hypothetical protein